MDDTAKDTVGMADTATSVTTMASAREQSERRALTARPIAAAGFMLITTDMQASAAPTDLQSIGELGVPKHADSDPVWWTCVRLE